jgi:hypothetical protein
MQSKFKGTLVAALAVLALSAVVATAAQAATEGPYFKVAGTRLLSGKTKEVKLVAGHPVEFTVQALYMRIVCYGAKLKAGATIDGSTGANAGTSKETIEYSECQGGASYETGQCEPEGGKITTSPLVGTLGYSSSTKTGPVLVKYHAETGSTFATIKFVGARCAMSSTPVTGTQVASVYAGRSPIEVGSNEVEAAKAEVWFSATEKTIWTESEKVLTSTRGGLVASGFAFSEEAETGLELAGGGNWGVFAYKA